MSDLGEHIRDIPDFPKPGILFKDITPLLLDASALSDAIGQLAAWARPLEVDFVVAAEARGFILGARRSPASLARGSFQRASRASSRTRRSAAEYILEYGVDALEIRTPTRWRTARGCCCTTTCCARAARRARWPS